MPNEKPEVDQVPVLVIRLKRVNSSASLPTLFEALDLERRVEHMVPLGYLITERLQKVKISTQLLNQGVDKPRVIRVGHHQRV